MTQDDGRALRIVGMAYRNRPLLGLPVLMLLVLMLGLPGRAVAQGSVTWDEPYNVSSTDTSSIHPAIVADGFGNVHVFWSEDWGGRSITSYELPAQPNTIYYRRWDGQTWTDPVSVLAVVDDPLADYIAVAVDREDRIHAVWTGLTRIYYSSAAANAADSPAAWATPTVISFGAAHSRYESDVAVDVMGRVHILYAMGGDSAGVYHTAMEQDTGVWTLPKRVSDWLRQNEVAFADVRLVTDGSGRLHAVWGTANGNGYSQAVFHARSESSGSSWEAPFLLTDAVVEYGLSGFPSLLGYGADEMLLIYADDFTRGRVERLSGDGGQSWSAPRHILAGMEGLNGFIIPLLDSDDRLHLVINMRPSADQRVGIYYAPRAGLDWTPIVPVAVDEPYGPSAHYTDATIRLGNEIHVAWTQLRSGEIWHVTGIIDGVAPNPAKEAPREPPSAAGVRAAGVTATSPAVSVPAPTEVLDGRLAETLEPGLKAPAPWVPIISAVVPALLLVASVGVLRFRRR